MLVALGNISPQHLIVNVLVAAALLAGMLLLLEVGRVMGLRRANTDPDAAKLGTTAVDSAVFGLLALLIAFTFSGAMGRFDQRRQWIVEECNALDVAYRRLDLLSPENAAPLREQFRKYLGSRLVMYGEINDEAAAAVEYDRSQQLQDEIWKEAVAACKTEGKESTFKLLLPAINDMFDITTTRMMGHMMHPPLIIFVMLIGLALTSALLAGYGMSGTKVRSWIHMLAFAVITAATVYVIIDIEYPRRGFVRLDAFDQVLVDQRKSMD
jgi:hypothetical protein